MSLNKKKTRSTKFTMPVQKPIIIAYCRGRRGTEVVFNMMRPAEDILWDGVLSPDGGAFKNNLPHYLLHEGSVRSKVFGLEDIVLTLGHVSDWLAKYLHLPNDCAPLITMVDRRLEQEVSHG